MRIHILRVGVDTILSADELGLGIDP